MLAGLEPDIAAGEQVFYAGGCASCHSAPNVDRDARLTMAGGRAFPSNFGTFYAPNIYPDQDYGIGDWSALDLYNAMRHGVSPDGPALLPGLPVHLLFAGNGAGCGFPSCFPRLRTHNQ